ncbi:uncharacterized protein LAESUDRAFT_693038 [Laetiporus sulphureus 93-53]|uniref:Hyaluronan-mediated motility receptor C-terminal domain-containing protein n=1 Tax=Laetiporus sulphureus 93-53 TaxID=1314785 RepID=A0A165GS09_9APHY|nr:uncharacterized protein LAESUDRAFT_693038 [Laetiporus sulphureus 93-53]KZT10728.1 hypothetical protein LAESUDRAFT_693038 [Laetiporus sulphureus 93-53]
MFPKGPRFPATKVSDVPGPNAYNPQDPEYDAYKRGAFLEKTNRFAKDEADDVPGPSTYNTDSKGTDGKPSLGSKTTADRYAMLQRKVEDLERVHAEGKKAHRLEVERLKLDLSRAQKSATEHSERADKLKKHNDMRESRVQELKKTTSAEQGELRELRTKLKASEHERAQLSSKQGEASEARKALQAAETRRREDVRERDKKISDLEKTLSTERKKRELVEARLAEVKGKVDGEVQESRAAVSDLKARLQEYEAQARSARTALESLQAQTADKEEDMLEKLEQHRALLTRVAQEYGRLASATVLKAQHDQLKHESAILQMRILKLERKLANTEGQVIELANLVRQTREENQFLSARLQEVDQEALYYSQRLAEVAKEGLPSPSYPYQTLEADMATIAEQLRDSEIVMRRAIHADLIAWAELDRLRCQSAIAHSSTLLAALDGADKQAQKLAAEHHAVENRCTELNSMLETLRAEHAAVEGRLAETSTALDISKAAEVDLKRQLEDARVRALTDMSKVQQMLQKEREGSKRLAEAAHKSRIAEEALQMEIEQLSAELAEAERYQDAYNSLVEEVDALVARNALAEEEAAHLSRFNAEIVGHNNPAQRIMYVEKIRREMHETKQELLMCTRERDSIQMQNEDLQHELLMYKSVAVPTEMKPRTMVTRIARTTMPIRNDSLNCRATAEGPVRDGQVHTSGMRKFETAPEVEDRPGDMTLEEIM